MLALGTGWTPDVLGDLPSTFRAACHWALYADAIVGDGIQNLPVPKNAAPEYRLDVARANANRSKLRTLLFPADE